MVVMAHAKALDPMPVLSELSRRLQGRLQDLRAFMDTSVRERGLAAHAFFFARSLDELATLKLMESVAWSQLEHHEQAFTAAHEAFSAVTDRASGHLQALVLTQCAATAAAHGDLRAAIRAARRAEALIVAEVGEDTPQTLVVRAQLIALLCRYGEDAAAVQQRRQRTLDLLAAQPHLSRERFERYATTFDGLRPPSWALCFCLRWRF
jgi:hypothetical protein